MISTSLVLLFSERRLFVGELLSVFQKKANSTLQVSRSLHCDSNTPSKQVLGMWMSER